MMKNEKSHGYPFRQSRDWLFSLFNRLIGLSGNWSYNASSISWQFGQAAVWAISGWFGDLMWLLRDLLFRMSAFKSIGGNWTIVFVGREDERLMVQHLFFPKQEIEWCEISRVAIWDIPGQSRKWLSEGVDLVICELSRFFPLSPNTALRFDVPVRLNQVVTLPENIETLLVGKKMNDIRNRINWAQRNGFAYRFSQSVTDYEFFYHRMYVPFIQARHGELARIAPYDGYMKTLFHRGGLLLVTQDNSPVAGVLCYRIGDTCFMSENGLLDANMVLFKQGVIVLTYWYTMLWASKQGVRKVDFAATRPWRSNGILRQKAFWKPNIRRFQKTHNAWHIYAQRISPALREHINQIGFISEIHGDFYSILIDSDLSSAHTQANEILATVQREGLKGVAILAVGSKRTLVN